MVGYVLGLSNACPVRYGLLFERFTDPDRSEFPDIDIDLCQDGRGEVINYVRAMEAGFQRLSTLPLSTRLIREMHAVILAGVTIGDGAVVHGWTGPWCR